MSHGIAGGRVRHLAGADERVLADETILFLRSCLRSTSASSMPSCVMRARVMAGSGASGFLPNVRPAPRWSHCTTVKCFTHNLNPA